MNKQEVLLLIRKLVKESTTTIKGDFNPEYGYEYHVVVDPEKLVENIDKELDFVELAV